MSNVREEMIKFFDRWEGSGLGLRKFGEQEGVSYAKIQYWRRQLASKPKKVGRPRHQPAERRNDTLIPVQVLQGSGPEFLEIVLPNGLCCRVPRGWDSRELKQALEVMRSC